MLLYSFDIILNGNTLYLPSIYTSNLLLIINKINTLIIQAILFDTLLYPSIFFSNIIFFYLYPSSSLFILTNYLYILEYLEKLSGLLY